MNPEIVFEDSDLLVINKPAGWVVNDADSSRDLVTVQKWLINTFNYPLAKSSEDRSGIVHRLDKDTSGVLVVAKNQKAFSFLQGEFKARRVEKQYLALVHGEIKEGGEINQPIARNPGNRRKFGVFFGGRDSVTSYEVLEVFKKNGQIFSLIVCYPKTGRTHQIRVHLRHLGHSLVGDRTYAERKTIKKDLSLTNRIFLHAEKISFTHPATSKKMTFETPLPVDLREVVDKLKKP